MTVDDYRVKDGDDDGAIAEDLMTSGAQRSGLGRRGLLGGLAAGVAGLLLPRPAAAELRNIRTEVVNQGWENMTDSSDIGVAFYARQGDTWVSRAEKRLKVGESATYESTTTRALVMAGAFFYLELFNPSVGYPRLTYGYTKDGPNGNVTPGGGMRKNFKDGESFTWKTPQVRDGRQIKITRRKDSDNFKEFLIELQMERRGRGRAVGKARGVAKS